MEPAIRFTNVSKRYALGERRTLRGAISKLARPSRWAWARNRVNPQQQIESERFVWALRDVNLQVRRGEALGIIGANGAGKTTILKLLAGITRPTLGEVQVRGRVASLIELGAGFHPDLTGRDNIYLNGVIMGLSRGEIDRKLDSIIEFAELEAFVDTPVKHYSSGMYARLGFAVAAHIDPDVLLLDEVLAVGDINFQSKCYRKVVELLSHGTTTLLVSHNPYVIRDYCQSALYLAEGQIKAYGAPNDIVREYQTSMWSAETEFAPPTAIRTDKNCLQLRVAGTQLENSNGIVSVTSGSRVEFLIEYEIGEPIGLPIFGVDLRAVGGALYASYATDFDGIKLSPLVGKGSMALSFESFNFPVGTYQIGLVLSEGRQENHILWKPDVLGLVVTQNDGSRGMFSLPHRWEINS